MSKLSKLITSPELFMKDFVKKQMSIYSEVKLEKEPEKVVKKNTLEKKMIPEKKNQNKTIASVLDPTLIIDMISKGDNLVSLIHCGEGIVVGYSQCSEWIQFTAHLRKSIVFLVRNLDLYKKLISEFPNRNIAYAKSPIDIEEILSHFNIKNICFTSNTANNIHLLRFNEYYHIFIGSFDNLRQPEMHKYFRVYDELWLNSESKLKDFILNVDPRHLVVKNIGNPYNDYLFSKNKCIKNLLYIPNFDLDIKDSCLLFLINIIKEKNNQDFIYNFQLEDESNKYLFDSSISEISHLINCVNYNSSNLEILSQSQAVICDFNDETIIKRYLSLNLPVLIYAPQSSQNNSEFTLKILESSLFESCYFFNNVDQLFEILNKLKDGIDDLKNNREEFLLHFCGISLNSDEIFKENLNILIN